jgi:site-specific recombinase XerD
MSESLAVTRTGEDWNRLKALVLDSVSSPITRRVYNLALDEFINWYSHQPLGGFTKATVNAWRAALELRRLGAVSINVRLTAVRKLAMEAADNGLIPAELASGIAKVKGMRSQGVRVGNWLSLHQAQALLNAPDVKTRKGLRDRAMLGLLMGCGLRRSEVAAIRFEHIQQRDGRWCIVDLTGKGGRVRTVPMPTWAKVAIDAWTAASGIKDGFVLRSLNRGDRLSGERITEKVVWQALQPYAASVAIPRIAPHDLRRTCAKLCRSLGGELEQIQLLLGHASIQTTERYLGTRQNFINAPNDAIKLKISD